MGYSKYVGRVGVLAVALGVGAAIASPTALAETTEAATTAPDGSAGTAGQQSTATDVDASTGQGAGDQGGTGDAGSTPPSADAEQPSSPTAESVEVAPGVVVSNSGGSKSPTEDEISEDGEDDADVEDPAERPATGSPSGSGGGERNAGEESTAVVAPKTQTSAQTVRAARAATSSAVSTLAATGTASFPLSAPTTTKPVAATTKPVAATPVTAINTMLKAVVAPILTKLLNTIPGIPANSPLGWILLGAARREFGLATTPTATVTAPVAKTMALTTDSAPMLMSFAAAVANLAPTVNAIFGTPAAATGAVNGQIVAADPENGTLTYAVAGKPSSGTLVFDTATAKFTYTPTTAQRIAAAVSATTNDTIAMTVTVSDGTNSVPTVVNIPVSASPLNKVGEIGAVNDSHAVAIAGTRAYVTNKSAGTVTVIDTVTNTVVKTIAVGAGPDSIAVKPDGTTLYVASSTNNTVKVVNTSTGAVAKTISITKPSAMAINSSGSTLYVTSQDAGTVTKITTSTSAVSGTVKLPAGSRPTGIVVSPDKTKIYVISNKDTGGGSVALIGYTSSTSSTIANLAAAPTALAISADNKRLYVTSADGKLSVIDTATKAVVGSHTVSGVPAGVTVSKDGSTVLVTDATGTVSAVNAATGALLSTFATRTSTTTTSVTPSTAASTDGTRLYVADAAKVHVVSLLPANSAPQGGTPMLGAPNATTGAVTGKVGATDPDGDVLKYAVGTKPTKGTVTVTADGTFTYTPTATARHAAATVNASTALTTDTFTVTVSDGKGATIVTPVTVSISPVNKLPVPKVTVYSPSATTGVVKGYVSSTDADYDVRTYQAGTQPKKGTLVVTSTNGAFTYTPTAEARHAAAKVGATAADKTDTFTVTVDDGHGGVVTATVTVAVSPVNAKPTAPTVTQSTDLTTGVVTGSVKSTDGDGDALTYTTTQAAKGTLTIQSNGSFTYTPTIAARQAAAQPGATTATKTDTVTVTVADGYGGTSTVTLTLAVTPAVPGNASPTNGGFQASNPNVAIGSVTGTVTALDPENDALTYTVAVGPSKGLVKVDAATGQFVYVPDVDSRYAAQATPGLDTDTFTVNVTDGKGGWTSVAVSVQVAPPVATEMDQRGTTVAVAAQEIHFYSQADTEKALDLLKAAGVTNIRILIPWVSVEMANDKWSWASVDRVVNAAAARDIEVLAVLNSTPVWASVPNVPLLSGRPADPQEFAEYASMVATRYAGKISAYEVWNEPNYVLFWAPGPNAAQYTELLKAAYPAIKAADPDAVVVAASVAAIQDFLSVTVNPVRFIEEMYANGAAGYFDALSFHPYLFGLEFSEGATRVNSPLDQLERVHDLMVANGDGNKKIWATEYGQPSALVSEAQQAEFIGDFLRAWRDLEYAGPAFIHTIRDHPDSDPNNASMGLFRADWTAKPALGVVTDIVNENNQIVNNQQLL